MYCSMSQALGIRANANFVTGIYLSFTWKCKYKSFSPTINPDIMGISASSQMHTSNRNLFKS